MPTLDHSLPFSSRSLRALLGPALLALTLSMAGRATAECVLGVSLQPDRFSSSPFFNDRGDLMRDVYVLLQLDGQADAVAYDLLIHTGGTTIRLDEWFGPQGTGINLRSSNGENVGLGECAVGFTAPIVVARYLYYLPDMSTLFIYLRPNPDENPDYPVYSNCIGDVLPCAIGPSVKIDRVDAGSTSFGAVKALFGS